uniref:Uncharacterized protein n=1 Tax=Arundo donax TaxID=35708 RepID=A0A0A9GNV1_ARUDO
MCLHHLVCVALYKIQISLFIATRLKMSGLGGKQIQFKTRQVLF